MALLTEEQLKHVLHGTPLSKKDKALLLLSVHHSPQNLQALKAVGRRVGLRDIESWNLADMFAKSGGMAIRTDAGWELHASGVKHVRSLAALVKINLVVTTASESLRSKSLPITNPATRAFVDEAITCFEAKQYRAAVVFSWVGAIALLYDQVASTHLPAFNAEAARRHPKWRAAKNTDDLARMGEHDFLDLLEYLGLIGRNVKQTLQNHCLQLRNSCGHPNSLQIAENSVAAHIEKLILNVYARF